MKTEIDCGVLTPPIREERDQIVTCQFAILNTPFPSTILEQFFSYLNTMLISRKLKQSSIWGSYLNPLFE
jgi:hypothetical protein